MRLYLDDDSVNPGFIRLLRRDGHDVQIPADVALARHRSGARPALRI